MQISKLKSIQIGESKPEVKPGNKIQESTKPEIVVFIDVAYSM